jgi:hypothetical protein
MTIFFELLNAFKGDKNTFCRFKYAYYGSFLCNTMEYNLKDGLSIYYGLEKADYYRPNEVNVEQDDYIDKGHQSPSVIEIVLLDIAICDANLKLPFKFLEYALIHFKYSDRDGAYYGQNKTNLAALYPSTLEFFQGCKNNEELITRSITIKCNKHVRFISCCDNYATIAEFDNENLVDYISIDSNFFGKDFYMSKYL